jgi:hypothetical protein
MMKVQAWERLQDPDYVAKLSMSEFESLLIKAGYTSGAAHKAAMEHGWERIRAGVTI